MPGINHHYLLDPHTATAWHMLKENGGKGIIVATAHPYKFEDVIVKALGILSGQEWIKTLQSGPDQNAASLPADYLCTKKSYSRPYASVSGINVGRWRPKAANKKPPQSSERGGLRLVLTDRNGDFCYLSNLYTKKSKA